MMALQSTETHNITLKNLALFRPKLRDFYSTSQIARFVNRPISCSEKESQSNDTLLHFVELSNVHNSDNSSNATRSNLMYKNV